MPPSPRPWANGRGRIPMSDLRDSPKSNSFRDTSQDDDDEYRNDRFAGGERDRMIPKPEFPVASRLPAQGLRRWRLFGTLSGLAVLVAMALLVTFHTNQANEADFVDMAPPTIPTEDTQFSGLATAWLPIPTGPIPTDPTRVWENEAPIETGKIRKAVVLSSYSGQTVNWLQNLPKYTKGWEIFRYMFSERGTEYLSVPSDNGREAMAFLTFIIEEYNQLPDYAVFTHGHDRAWHQPEHTIDKLMALNLTALYNEGYINLRCAKSPGCTKDTKFYFRPHNKDDHRPGMLIEEGFWRHMMSSEFGDLPAVLGRRCCASFAVTKQAIQLHSHEFWKSMRRPLEGSIDEIRKQWGPNVDKYSLGSLYEQVWHVLFGKPPDFCPTKEYCEKVHFSDMIHCDGETTSFKENKSNWQKISCSNGLRTAIDQGVPLDSVLAGNFDIHAGAPHEALDDAVDTVTDYSSQSDQYDGQDYGQDDGQSWAP